MGLPNQLKRCRKRNRLTQGTLAQKLHVSRKTVSNWENGRNYPSLDILMKISRIYQVPLDDLLKDDADVSRNSDHSCKFDVFYYLNLLLIIMSYLGLFGFTWALGFPVLLLVNTVWLIYLAGGYRTIVKHQIKAFDSVLLSIVFLMVNVIASLNVGWMLDLLNHGVEVVLLLLILAFGFLVNLFLD